IQTDALLFGTLPAGPTGDVNITATSHMTGATDAMPADAPADSSGGASGVTAGSVGIGASVAVALVDDVTRAELIGTLNGGHNVTIAATTSDAMATHAKTGAAGGDVAVVPSVAITLSNVTTLATIGGGADLNITGAFSASTDQSASAGSTAEGDAQGKDAAIGVSLALTIANDSSETTLVRNLYAGGAVTLAAEGSSDSSASAKAGAAGAPGDASGSAGAPADSTSGSVTQQVAGQRGFADQTSRGNGGSGDGGPADSSGGGSSGAPSDSSSGVSIGVAVAINYVRVFNLAVLPIDATVISHGATIQALSGGMDELGASATSGAGGGSVGIAGSVAIDIENIDTEAVMAGVLTAGTGDVTIAAASHATSNVEALPKESGVSGVGSVGIGASVAVAIVDDLTTASLLGQLNGGGNLTLTANTSHFLTTHSKTGAAGGNVAVVPS